MKKKHRSAFVPIKDNNYTPVMDRGPSEVLRGQGFIVLIALGKAMSGWNTIDLASQVPDGMYLIAS